MYHMTYFAAALLKLDDLKAPGVKPSKEPTELKNPALYPPVKAP